MSEAVQVDRNGRTSTVYKMWMAWAGGVFHANPDCCSAQGADGGRWVTNQNGDWRPCRRCMIDYSGDSITHTHPYSAEYYGKEFEGDSE